ncbi:J domain-containing protein required for chloroplast accumulation response 1-like isoform X2 [Bidens hawaiensis]|uniref:J domain-containing protein required for chloroplast accumulation response 1-like isoform X2 n=1 Tax=Bidens hawaiensis TaxID=980011 RepID=UPI00404B3C1D
MEKISRTANLSLRYSLSQKSLENIATSSSSSSSSIRNNSDNNNNINNNNDVDFDDVFGGPPTRTRYSFGGGRNKSSSSQSGLGERPVFGESYGSPRTRTSDDFYDDIFRRSDESVRSPRWRSPTALSPAKNHTFSTLVPSDFSLPPKMTEDAGIPVFGSNVHIQNAHLSRFSNPATQIFRSNSGQPAGKTLLSRESSSAKESLHSTQSTEAEVDHKSNAKTTGTRSPSTEFHFSIHKWPNVGVPLLMSLRGGKHYTLKGSSKVSAVSVDNMQESGFPNEDLSSKKEDTKPVSGVSLMDVIEKETLAVKPENNVQHEVIAPSSLLHDELERKGYEEAGKEAETKEKMETASGKKKPVAKKTNKPSVGSPKNRVKGMVKDFFKISNQESPPKAKTNVSSRWKTGGKSKTQEEVDNIISNLDTNPKITTDASKPTKLASELPSENVKMAPDASTAIPLHGKMPAENVNKMPDSSFMVNSTKQKSASNRTIRKLEDINFQQDTTPSSESVPNGSKASVENIDDIDNFQVQELATVDDSKTQEESEAIMALDSKIHTWSNGRKGNIRSLLSTLQLVLWAESGWKPVALVDIIEANAVKKAYNRAMLCLHPDKLQQKGADSHKKYIAEKVFNILQEAWDHYNTLGTLL